MFVISKVFHSLNRTAEGSLFDHTRIISTVAVTQGTNSITSSSTDIKSCQSFPPNFYTEISYENDAGNLSCLLYDECLTLFNVLV